MTSIDASQRLALLLRTQLSALQAPGRKQRASPATGSAQDQSPDLASVVAQRIHALAKDDPDRKRKALRIYLESLLLEQLGSGLVRDSSFGDMVDAVQSQMEADREIAAAADALSEILIAAGPRT